MQNTMKKDDEDRKTLWTENKILKLAVQTLEKQHASLELQLRNHLTESNEKNQYDCRECLEVRGIPQRATPSEENTNAIIIEKLKGKLIGVDILDNDISVSHRLPQAKPYIGEERQPITNHREIYKAICKREIVWCKEKSEE